VQGVDHVVRLLMRRPDHPAQVSSTIVEVAPEEIILVENDSDHMELGSIRFELEGGRR
jgi:hypothetical protein